MNIKRIVNNSMKNYGRSKNMLTMERAKRLMAKLAAESSKLESGEAKSRISRREADKVVVPAMAEVS